MKRKLVSAALTLAALASPALAQDDQKKADDANKLYQTAMECAGAAMALPFLETNLSAAQTDAYKAESEYWLGIGIMIGENLKMDVVKDSEISAYRFIAHLDLVGDAKTKAFYKEIHATCHQIYGELNKPQ